MALQGVFIHELAHVFAIPTKPMSFKRCNLQLAIILVLKIQPYSYQFIQNKAFTGL